MSILSRNGAWYQTLDVPTAMDVWGAGPGWTWSPSPDMSCSPYWATVELWPSWQDPVPISHAVI